jgi:hypothetical protein
VTNPDNFTSATAFAGKTDQADHGTIIGTSWSGVTISWNDGHASSVRHNDMGEISLVPMKV